MEMELTFEKIFKTIRKKLALVIAIVVACTLGLFFVSEFVMAPSYTCQMKFRVNVGSSGAADLTNDTRLMNLTSDIIERIKSDKFYAMVSENAQGSVSSSEVERRISFTIVEDTTVFWIAVSGPTSEQTYLLGKAVEKAAPEYIDSNGEIYAITPLVSAKLPMAPSSPNVMRNTALGFVLGAVLAVAVAVLIDFFDRRIKNSADIVDRFSLPLLGVVPCFETNERKGKK